MDRRQFLKTSTTATAALAAGATLPLRSVAQTAKSADEAKPRPIQNRVPSEARSLTSKIQNFSWLADADTRLGPVIELHMEGKYYWVPMSRIRRIALEPPANLIDLVFAPAQFVWTNGGEAAGFIPVRYASGSAKFPLGSESDPDPRCLLSRLTQWSEATPAFAIGSGQRLLATDTGEYPLLDIRIIDFAPTN